MQRIKFTINKTQVACSAHIKLSIINAYGPRALPGIGLIYRQTSIGFYWFYSSSTIMASPKVLSKLVLAEGSEKSLLGIPSPLPQAQSSQGCVGKNMTGKAYQNYSQILSSAAPQSAIVPTDHVLRAMGGHHQLASMQGATGSFCHQLYCI